MKTFKDALPFASKLNRLMKEEKYLELDEELACSVEDKSDLYLISLIRGTYRVRNNLRNWDTMLNRIRQEFLLRHKEELEVEALLIGLK